MDSLVIGNPETDWHFRHFPAGVNHCKNCGSGARMPLDVIEQVPAFLEFHVVQNVPEKNNVQSGVSGKGKEVGKEVVQRPFIGRRKEIKVAERGIEVVDVYFTTELGKIPDVFIQRRTQVKDLEFTVFRQFTG